MTADEQLMNVDQARAMLNVSRGWIYKHAKSGDLPHRRLGGPDGPLRFVPEELEAFIENARSGWQPGAATLKPD